MSVQYEESVRASAWLIVLGALVALASGCRHGDR